MNNPPNLIDKPHTLMTIKEMLTESSISEVLLVVLRPDHQDYQGTPVSER